MPSNPKANGRRSNSDNLGKVLPEVKGSNFGLTFQLDGARALVLINGEVDIVSASRLQECVELLMEQGALRIDVDLREVTFMDSQGMVLLVTLNRRLLETGGQLRVLHPRPFIRKVFRVAGVDRFLEVVA